ncbi:MAG: hypothetical protein CL908_02960 [Deltaproteobacteria bacterium]|nr:hypothetical protein [Deltaproteobacteria bacterium]
MPDPIHPALVHLPIALAILIPGLALFWIVLIQRDFLPARSWAVLVLLQALLVGSGWLALETGEEQEDRVERFVAERHIEAHEEAAERFLLLAGLGLLASGAGLLPRRAGRSGRMVGALASFVVLAAGFSVGHSGGELVYVHGAATAYVDPSGTGAADWIHEDD